MAKKASKPRAKKERVIATGGGKVGAVLLGVLIGFVGTVGGIVGGGFIFANTATVESVTTTVGNITGTEINYQEYITEEYAKKTIVELVGSVQTLAEDLQKPEACFNTLNKVSPKVSTTVEELIKTLQEYGVELSHKDTMEKPFTQLGEYLGEAVNAVKVGKLLDKLEIEQSAILLALCYGEEGVHYTKTNGVITMLGNNQETTIGDLTSGDTEKLLSRVPLDAILEIGANDDLMQSVAYGNTYQYTVAEDGTVTMNQVKYYMKGDKLYDESGNEVVAEKFSVTTTAPMSVSLSDDTLTVEGYKVTVGENETVYAVYSEDAGCYLAYQYTPGSLPIEYRYKKTTFHDLLSSSNDLLSSLELASVMKLDATSEPFMLALAYGDNYVISGNNVYAAEGSSPLTVGDIMSEDGFSDVFDNVKLATILDISPLDNYDDDPENDPDSLMISLAYGEEGTHYKLEDTDNDGKPDTVTYIGENTARTLGTLMNGDENLFRDITLDSILDLNKNSDTLLVAMALGKENRYHFDDATGKYVMNPIVYTYDSVNDKVIDDSYESISYSETETDGVWEIQVEDKTQYISETDGVYYAYETIEAATAGLAKDRLTYPKTLLADLMGSNATNLINDVQLCTVFGVTLTQENPDEFMNALSFGYEGTHYEKDGDVITWKTNPDTERPYAPRTIADLRDSASFMDDLRLETILEVDAYSSAMLIAICYGEKGTDYTIEENVDHDNDPSTPAINVIHATNPRTIGMLKTDKGVFDNIALDSLLTADHEDAVTMYMLYGKKGVHYNIDSNGNVDMLQMKIAVHENLAYDEFGDRITGTSVDGLNFTYKDTLYLLEETSNKLFVNISEDTTAEATVYKVFNTDGTEKEYHRHTIGDLSNGDLVSDITEHLTIGEFLNVTEEDGKLLNTLKDKKFGDLKDAIPNLKVGEVLDDATIRSNRFLRHLSDSTLTTMGTDIDDLTIQVLFEDQVYKLYKDENGDYRDEQNNVIYYDQVSGTFYTDDTKQTPVRPMFLNQAGAKLYYNSTDGKYYTSPDFTGEPSARALVGSWKYMLSDIETGKEHTEYTISHVEAMVKKMTENMHVATLNQLSEDGILQIDDGILERELVYSLSYTYDSTPIPIPIKAFIDDTQNTDEEKNAQLRIEKDITDNTWKYYKVSETDGTHSFIETIGELNVEQILDYTEKLLDTFTAVSGS